MRIHQIAGLDIEQYQSPNVGGAMDGHRGIVLHIAQGTYRGTIDWQLNPDQRYRNGTKVTTSSTWIVGRDRGQWAQMVDSDTVAWAQRDGSRTWLSIELTGFAPEPPTAWQIEACAHLLAWAHRAYGVPLAVADHPGERGLGHHSMDREWRDEEWGHDQCPGTGVVAMKGAIVRRASEIQGGKTVDKQDVGKIFNTDGVIAAPEHSAPGNDFWTAASFLRSIVGAVRVRITDRWRDIWPDESGWTTAGVAARRAAIISHGARAEARAVRGDVATLRAEVAELTGQVAGLVTLAQQLLTAPPVQLTPAQLDELAQVVADAAREPGDRVAAALAAIGETLVSVAGDDTKP